MYNYNKDHVQKKDFGGVALVDIRERFSGQWPKAAQKLPFRQAFNLEDSDNQILVPDNRKHQSTRYGTGERSICYTTLVCFVSARRPLARRIVHCDTGCTCCV